MDTSFSLVGNKPVCYECDNEFEKQPVVIVESKPDSFEKKEKTSLTGKVAVAGIGAAGFANPIKKIANSLPDKIENTIKNVANDFGKEVNLPKMFKPIAKYTAIVGLSIGAFMLAFKDSDNDGQLDILEGIKKVLTPQ